MAGVALGVVAACGAAAPASSAFPSDLSSLPSTRYYGLSTPSTLPGQAPLVENAGYAVAGECDLDGDDRPDLAIGAPLGNSPLDVAATAAGRVYVRFGAEHENLATGTLRIEGEPVKNGRAGVALACGDVSGDGIDDLVIAATQVPRANPTGANAGRLYVLFGAGDLASRGTVRLDQLGSQGYVIIGPAANAWLGGPNGSGAGAGALDVSDVAGDDRAEILVAARASHVAGRTINAGTGYVIDGQSTSDPVDLAASPPQLRLRLDGGNHGVELGDGTPVTGAGQLYTIAAVGDVTGDGHEDIAVGEVFRRRAGDGANVGSVSVISGTRTGVIEMQTTAADQRPEGVSSVIWGISPLTPGTPGTGMGLAPVGDVNGDGTADFAIATTQKQPTQVAVVFGSDSPEPVQLDELGERGYTIVGPSDVSANTDDFGLAMTDVGDVDGDDRPDLLIGAPAFSGLASKRNSGAAYLVYGRDEAGTIDSGALTDEQGALLYGDETTTYLGRAVSRAGTDPETGAPRVLIGAASINTRGYGNYAQLLTLADPGEGPGGEPPASAEAEVDWGFRESFRRYVNGGWSAGSTHTPIVASDGARCDAHPNPLIGGCDPKQRQLLTDPPPPGALWFTPTGLDHDPVSGNGAVSTRGTVTFDFPGHFFRLMLQDPRFAIADGRVTVSARVKLDVDPLFGTYPSVDQWMTLGDFDLVGPPTLTDKLITWKTATGTLRPEAAATLGDFLPAGAELDPAVITAPRAMGPADPEPIVPLDPEAPPLPPAPPASPSAPAPPAPRATPAKLVRTTGTIRSRKRARRLVTVRLGRGPATGAQAWHRVWLTRKGRIVARGELRGRTLRLVVAKTRPRVVRTGGRRIVRPGTYPRLRGRYVVRPAGARSSWSSFTVRVR